MLKPNEIARYRRRLEELGLRHSGDLARLRSEASHGLGGESGGGISNAPTHLADLGTAHHEEEVGLLLVENQEWLLTECEAALACIDAGTFGLCERCSQPIPASRLDAFPYARWCVRCATVRQGQKTG
jgi:RNA polymerase-binding transcription factor DksA